MVTRRQIALSLGVVAGFLLAGGAGWSLYQSRTTPRVPYETLRELDGVEIRRYPSAVAAETTAPTENEAFRRLFRYISGANTGAESVSMTAPVEVTAQGAEFGEAEGRGAEFDEGKEQGSKVPTTGRIEVDPGVGFVRMAFYLPPEFDAETAPQPTDPEVRVVTVPERTLGVKRFSWWPTAARVRRQTVALRRTLADADVPAVSEPFRLGYDAPWTPPFLRTNEVAVEVRWTGT